MRARQNDVDVREKRLLGIDDAAKYIGMGRVMTRKIMDEIGATRRIGRRVLFDKKIIDEILDKMESCTGATEGSKNV